MQSEYLRQLLHICFGSAIILALVFLGRQNAIALSATGLVLAAILSLALKNKIRLPLIQKSINMAKRKNESKFPARGAIAFFCGVLIVLIFFEKFQVELGALLVLALGDGFSTIFGTLFGKIKLTSKHTLEGTVAGILVSFIALAAFLDWFLALFVATIAMLSELIGFEDNITIPITAAILLSVVL